MKKQRLEELAQSLWKILELGRDNKWQGTQGYEDFVKEQENFGNLLYEIPEAIENLSPLDTRGFISSLVDEDMANSGSTKITQVKRDILSKLLRKPKAFTFYFRVGQITGQPASLRLGHGELLSYGKLPDRLRTTIEEHLEFPISEDDPSLEDIKPNAQTHWYFRTKTQASGRYQALENAVVLLRRSIAIHRLAHLGQPSSSLLTVITPYDYWFLNRGRSEDVGGGMTLTDRSIEIDFDYTVNSFVRKINKMISRENGWSDLEDRIFRALDIYALNEDIMPARMQLFLCVAALESILRVGDEQKQSTTLAERVSALIEDNKELENCMHNYLNHGTSARNSEFFRANLEKVIKGFYGKRSAFAHSGGGSNKRNKTFVGDEDVKLASFVLRLVIEKVLNLIEDRNITKLAKDNDEDSASMVVYLEKKIQRRNRTQLPH